MPQWRNIKYKKPRKWPKIGEPGCRIDSDPLAPGFVAFYVRLKEDAPEYEWESREEKMIVSYARRDSIDGYVRALNGPFYQSTSIWEYSATPFPDST